METTVRARQIDKLLAILNCPYPSNSFTKLESYCFSVFGGVVIKKKKHLMLPWQLNRTTTGYKTHELDRQMIITAKYGSYHFTGNGENAI